MGRQLFQAFIKKINEIAEDNELADFHAFVFWFISNSFDLNNQKTPIRDLICDKTHDKGIDAIVIDENQKKIVVIQSKFERAGRRI